jgi:hypothetical protein
MERIMAGIVMVGDVACVSRTPEEWVAFAREKIVEIRAWTCEEAESGALASYERLARGRRQYFERLALKGEIDPREEHWYPEPVQLTGEEFRQKEICRLQEHATYWTHAKK